MIDAEEGSQKLEKMHKIQQDLENFISGKICIRNKSQRLNGLRNVKRIHTFYTIVRVRNGFSRGEQLIFMTIFIKVVWVVMMIFSHLGCQTTLRSFSIY